MHLNRLIYIVPSKYTDQLAHPCSLMSLLGIIWEAKKPILLNADSKDESDSADEQVVESSLCAHHFVGSAVPQPDKTILTCAPSEHSDQPGHPSSLIRVFPVCLKKP